MQFKNNKYFSIALYVFLVGTSLILVWFLFNNLSGVWDIIKKLYDILMPFVYGFVFAYLLKPIVNWFERRVFVFISHEPKIKKELVEKSLHDNINKERRRVSINKVMSAKFSGTSNFINKDNHEILSLEEIEKIKSNKKKLIELIRLYLSECENENDHKKIIEQRALKVQQEIIFNDKMIGRKKLGRVLSMVTTYLVIIAALSGFVYILVPNLIESISTLIAQVPALVQKTESWSAWLQAQNMPSYIQVPKVEDMVKLLENYSSELTSIATDTVPWLVNVTVSITSGIFTTIIGIVVSIYMLFNKEVFAEQAKKILCAVFSKQKTRRIIEIFGMIDDSFGGFISGRITTSIIIGILCYIGMIIMDLPYAVLVSVLVAVTNPLPYVGPFLGGIPSALMILLVDPLKAVIFIVFIVVLQQLEGNVISVLITGKKTGMSAFWVMFSVILGGGLFGVLGMFIGVPFFAVFYALGGESLRAKLDKKGCAGDVEKYLSEE